MDLFKALTGKNPAEFEKAGKMLVDTPDVELFKKLVKQDDFLFDFVKNNVSKRIRQACNKSNYENLLQFLDYYSPTYDEMITTTLFDFGEGKFNEKMKELYKSGNTAQKTYAAKYLTLLSDDEIQDLLPIIRENSKSDDEFLSNNSIEILAKISDTESLFEQNFDASVLVLCNIVNAIPEIVSPSASIDYNLLEIFEKLYYENLTRSSALLPTWSGHQL